MSIEYSVYGDAEKRLKDDFFNTTISSPTNDLIFTKPDAVKLVLDAIERNNPNAFNSVTKTYCDIASKSGAFLIGIAERIFNSEEAKRLFPNPYKRIRHIYQYQIFGLTSNLMCWWTIYQRIYRIYDRESKKEIIEPFCKQNVLNVERLNDVANFNEEEVLEMFRKQSNFSKEVTVNDWDEIEVTDASSDRKFDYIISNPPYQGSNHSQLYPSFYVKSIKVANNVCMIFPSGWQEPKNENGLSKMNTTSIKNDKQIVFIQNNEDVFSNTPGAKYTNVIQWKNGYDNGLCGKQRIIDCNGDETIVELLTEKAQIKKPDEIISICRKVDAFKEKKMHLIISARKPYGFEADPIDNPKRYGVELSDTPNATSVRLFGRQKGVGRTTKYIQRESLPKTSAMLDAYKLFIVKAWGNMSEANGHLGGSYSQLIIGEPGDCCSETYLEVGPFSTREEAENAYKYFNTKFFRAVFYNNKFSQNTARETYSGVPQQNFSDASDIDWSKSIADISVDLCKKYGLSDEEIKFVETKIKDID